MGNLSGGDASWGSSGGGFGSAFGGAPSGGPNNGAQMVMAPGVTYGIESFDISIGFNDQTPNVESTLDWKNIHVVGIAVSGEKSIKGIPVIYEAFYGMMREGKGKFIDRDYSGNNKTLLWSETVGKVVGSAIDGSLGAPLLKESGFRFLAGALFTQRDYEMRDNKQTQANDLNRLAHPLPRPAGPVAAVGTVFQGKNGTYKVQIFGPWIGGDMELELAKGIKFNGALKGVYGFYKAKGVWPTYSFQDTSKAYGAHAKLGVTADVYRGIEMFANVGMKYYKIKKGSVKTKSGAIYIDYFRGGTFKSYMASLGGKVPF